MDVRLPDGTVISNVPEGTTKAQLTEKLRANGYDIAKLESSTTPAPQPQSPNALEQFADYAKANTMGALSGAADIGNTLINAATFIPRKALGEGNALEQWNTQREQALQDFNRENDSAAFTTGRIGANIAGTAAMPSVIGGAATALGAPRLGAAISSGGIGKTSSEVIKGFLGRAKDLAIRTAGGAIAGGSTAGVIDPQSAETGAIVGAAIPVAAPVVKAIGSGAANVFGVSTGAGGQAVKEAARAGYEGGAIDDLFVKNMRGEVPVEDVLSVAKSNLARMKEAKNLQYKSNMADVASDKSILKFDGVDSALSRAQGMTQFKGKVKNEKAGQVLQQINDEIAAWKNLDPAEYHTPEGLDALKQKIGGIRDSISFDEKSAKTVANEVYNALKKEITKQAPSYSKAMKEYSDAADLIGQIENSLLSKTGNVDTAMRKLQSIMRNNVNTNYGNRLEMARRMEEAGGQELLPQLAGQALNNWVPRGLSASVASGIGGAGILTANPLAVPAIMSQSPRLVGETARAVGTAARGAQSAITAAGPLSTYLNIEE